MAYNETDKDANIAQPPGAEWEERKKKLSKEIREGKRKPKREIDGLPEEQKPKGFKKLIFQAKRGLKGLGAMLLAFISGVIRKTYDRMTGSNWEETAKNAKADVLALDEVKEEEEKAFEEKIKAQQQALSELHLAHAHLAEDMKAATTNNLMGEEHSSGALPNGGSIDVEGTGLSSRDQAEHQYYHSALAQLSEMYQYYSEQTDDRYEAVVDGIVTDADRELSNHDMAGMVKTIHRALCALDPELGGRKNIEKSLVGANAMTRIAANQVIGYEISEKLMATAIESGRPAEFLDDMAWSARNDPRHKNEFLKFIREEHLHYSKGRDSLYKVARSPSNDPGEMSWGWLAKASKEFAERLGEIQGLEIDRQGVAFPREETVSLPCPEVVGLESEVVGEQPSHENNESHTISNEPNPVDRTPSRDSEPDLGEDNAAVQPETKFEP